MPDPDLQHLDARLARVEDHVERIRDAITRIEAAVFVMDRDSSLGVDAYNGLRKQVIASASERQAHLHQLAQFADAVAGDVASDQLQSLVREWMGQADLQVVTEPATQDQLDAFELHGSPSGAVRILRPAIVDGRNGRVVRLGHAEYLTEPPSDGGHVPGGDPAIDEDQPTTDLQEEQP